MLARKKAFGRESSIKFCVRESRSSVVGIVSLMIG